MQQEICAQIKLSSDLVNAIRSGNVEARWHQEGPPPHRVEFVSKIDASIVLATFTTNVAPPNHLLVGSAQTTPSAPHLQKADKSHDDVKHDGASDGAASSDTNTTTSTNVLITSEIIDASIAKHLAKQVKPVSLESLIKHVHSEHAATPRNVIERAVQKAFEDAPGGAKSVVEIPPRLASIVSPNWYDTFEDRKRAANRISILLGRQQLPFEHWINYVDKDVFLDLHSPGGIMSGMSAKVTAAADVAAPSDVEGDDSHNSGAAARRSREGDDGAADDLKRKRRRIEHLREIDVVDWEGAGSLFNTSAVAAATGGRSGNIDEIECLVNTLLAKRRVEEHEALEKTGSSIPNIVLRLDDGHPSTTTTTSASAASSPSPSVGITQLVQWLADVESRLSSHETVCSQLRHILIEQYDLLLLGGVKRDESNNNAILPLASEIENWLAPQLPVRQRLLVVLRKLRFEISHQVREDNDRTFINSLLQEFDVTSTTVAASTAA
ncbi:Hypothetical protein, putative [Bodo saltans]|uniref:Uncharacterized protein n=1 Tax=Bodo saltans TaxID=75058 RepID=A0A0S4KL34_BODSA|nr:Hypothetical protein, putative [Bodo saltans]|eukprot:CUI15079.1 Hypothetical protein, putative [Bodo saltans]